MIAYVVEIYCVLLCLGNPTLLAKLYQRKGIRFIKGDSLDSKRTAITGMHVAHQFSVPPRAILTSPKRWCGKHIDTSEFLRHTEEFAPF